ncbi:MAG TPA: NUDIX domain-containing protein [Candidatus Saccharimonadia bacterium]|nr:NUDIX domain-containing protein [Candidatus Saccharimonadia bacterium]
MPAKSGVFASVLDDEGRILLGHRRDLDLWEAPGGNLDPGEAPWDAVVREIKEETGITAEVIRLTGLYYRPSRGNVVYHFVCKVVSGTPVTSDETDKVEFFEPGNLPEHITPVVRDRLQDSLVPSGVAMAVQDGPGGREWLKSL